MSRYLIAGASGMLGRDLHAALDGRNVTALSRQHLDISDLEQVRAAAAGHDVIINAAAYTKVDDAETHEADAHRINADGAANLALVAAEIGAVLVQVSTDYVFDGTATTPYPEAAAHNPVSAYGRTKAAGETRAREANPDATLIVRTAWLYGEHGPNFVKTMLRLAGERDELSVVDDQVGQPTWARDLAAQIVALLDTGTRAGTFHGTASDQASWFALARATFELTGLDPARVKPVDSAQFVRPAPRPAYSVLGHDSWAGVGLQPMRPWKTALAEALASGALRA